jgi:hypothetical protein
MKGWAKTKARQAEGKERQCEFRARSRESKAKKRKVLYANLRKGRARQ